MAREEHDREDLIREATALGQRAEMRVAGEDDLVVVGFRDNGCGSVFFGADPVYHFNSHDLLRRAYADGRLIKAQQGELVALTRCRTPTATQLVSQSLAEDETQAFLSGMARRLEHLAQQLDANRVEVVRQVGFGDNPREPIRSWITRCVNQPGVADRPHAR